MPRAGASAAVAHEIALPFSTGRGASRSLEDAAPSAGALYPLEVFLVAGDVEDLPRRCPAGPRASTPLYLLPVGRGG